MQSDRPGGKRGEGITAGLHLEVYLWYLSMERRGWLVRAGGSEVEYSACKPSDYSPTAVVARSTAS